MGELARRRRARDLWISKAHLRAAGGGVFLLTATAFAAGWMMGHDGSPQAAPEATAWLASAPGEDVVELLARVEASRSTRGGVEVLTYPDGLAGLGAGQSAHMGPHAAVLPVELDAHEVEPPEPDLSGLPAGRYRLDIARGTDRGPAERAADALEADGLSAFIGVELVDGVREYVVAAGAFADVEAATALAAELEALGIDSAVLDTRPPEAGDR